MMSCLFGTDLAPLQPLIFVSDEVYVKTRLKTGQGILVTASGIEHPLRRFCSVRNLVEHHHRVNTSYFEQLLQKELIKRKAADCTDPLVYFTQYLVPLWWGANSNELQTEIHSPGLNAFDNALQYPDFTAETSRVIDNTPLPHPPSPSFWVLGRFWYMAETPFLSGRMHIRLGGRTLALTGEYTSVHMAHNDWCNQLHRYITESADELLRERQTYFDPYVLEKAKSDLLPGGSLQYGDLLYIPGKPPRLGHVIPPHNNKNFRRKSDQDLAMTAFLQWPPTLKSLSVYEKASNGNWQPVRLKNGLCLGRQPPGIFQNKDWHSLAIFLRWAAIRIAVNGRFHEKD